MRSGVEEGAPSLDHGRAKPDEDRIVRVAVHPVRGIGRLLESFGKCLRPAEVGVEVGGRKPRRHTWTWRSHSICRRPLLSDHLDVEADLEVSRPIRLPRMLSGISSPIVEPLLGRGGCLLTVEERDHRPAAFVLPQDQHPSDPGWQFRRAVHAARCYAGASRPRRHLERRDACDTALPSLDWTRFVSHERELSRRDAAPRVGAPRSARRLASRRARASGRAMTEGAASRVDVG